MLDSELRTILVTGGAGFIGSNLSAELARQGHRVRVFDNLSRNGVRRNAEWLAKVAPDRIDIQVGDVRDREAVAQAADGVQIIYHLASQVAVTTSVADPRTDFEINATGTINILEAARCSPLRPAVFYTSTNKVYGGMEDVRIEECNGRYLYADLEEGVNESRPLDFHSPYGCSKGAGDQYVRDYARIYGLKTVVFRMSCIYGPRQFGNEDQGWVAHFAHAFLERRPVTIYGDGKQVRDILFVEDLVRAFCLATNHLETTGGQVYNIGGGMENVISLLELMAQLRCLRDYTIPVRFYEWRPGDQRVYVSDAGKAARDFGWRPQVSKAEGLHRLVDWLCSEDANPGGK
jgi:CDP-paratose 2-epimerase